MSNLYDDLMKYKDWTGNREEFIAVIDLLEQFDPSERMLASKKDPQNRLPINARRIQWFTSMNIIPKAIKRIYEFTHLVYYWHAILLRKQRKGRLTFEQISGQIDRIRFEDALNRVSEIDKDQEFEEIVAIASGHMTEDDITEGLIKLGRTEGRPLKATLTRYAITPWCHVTINETHTRTLTSHDVDILAKAFRKSLNEIVKQ